MITPLPEGMIRVELSLGENVETKVFKQKKFQDKPDRIVIDIEFPEVGETGKQEERRGEDSKKNKIIVIDPGHGGDDPGAVGKHEDPGEEGRSGDRQEIEGYLKQARKATVLFLRGTGITTCLSKRD